MERFDVIIIGAGIAGSAAAYRLASHTKVLLLEQFDFLHTLGSSHGGSRIFRHAYEDARYVRLAVAAQKGWRRLEGDADERLLFTTGGLDVGSQGGEELAAIAGALRAAERPFERLDAKEVGRRFPAVRLSEDQEAVFQPDAGILAATRCLNAMQRTAAVMGVVLRDREGVTRLEVHPDHVEVRTEHERYAADRLVITAGPWLGEVLVDLELPLHVEQQQVIYLRVENAPHFAPGTLPVFINYDTGVYGFPLFEGPTAIKVSDHSGAPTIFLDERRFDLDQRVAEATIRRVQRFLPEVTSELIHFETCLYTKTPDEHFILDTHPAFDHVVVAGGFSGHGFKFGPVLGEILADLALEGRSSFDLSLFGLNRFALQTTA